MPASLFHTLNISRQDMLSRLSDLDVTSSNLANINTAGYKANRSNFQELLNQQVKEGTQMRATQLLTMQGSLRDLTNPLDWAIQGEGFFSVTLPDGGTGYTRDGQFTLDAERNLVTASGYPLVWDGDIPEGTTSISIDPDGTITALDANGASTEGGGCPINSFPQSHWADRQWRQYLAGIRILWRRPDRCAWN